MQSKAHSLSLLTMIWMVVLFCAAAVIAAPAQNVFFTSLYSFCSQPNCPDGASPYAGLVQGTDGNFYGTTLQGGAYGGGEVFKMAPTGALTILYSFCSQPNCTDGVDPDAVLVQAMDGNFYGTTLAGGDDNGGTVFKITPSGTLTTLHSLNGADGGYPQGGLVQASDGNFYGTAEEGGNGYGTVFSITPGGTLTTLHTFNFWDGEWPLAGLVQGSDGNFYGTTYAGGTSGKGTVFKMTPDGTLTTLYSFCYEGYCSNGSAPTAGLVQGRDGDLYGTAWGDGNGSSTAFKITPSGGFTLLHTFCSQPHCADGYEPYAGLLQGTDGNFYGTTERGGGSGYGTAFKITPSGGFTLLYTFCSQPNCTDGTSPLAGLMQARDGNFYGTTSGGGAYGGGTVFRLGVVRACATCRP